MDVKKSLSRKEFLKFTGVVAGASASLAAAKGLISELQESDPHYETIGEEKIIPTVCLMCPSGCGMLARVVDGNLVKMEGNPMHPINLGALCPKGQAAPELLYNPDRITGPKMRVGERGSRNWEDISWEKAIQIVSEKIMNLRSEGKPERTALMYGETRGQLRSFFERFMSAIGSPNIISHDSLNIEAAKLATLYTQGVYDLPVYDIENSSYIISFGSSLLEAGRTPQRVISGYSFLRRGRTERGKVVVFDPRQGISGAKADEWIPINPGTDAALALSICHAIIKIGQFDSDFVNNYSFGFDDFTDDDGKQRKGFKNYILENFDPKRVEKITGIPATTISRIAGEFAGNRPAIAIMPGKGGLLNGNLNGLNAAMAINCLNALVGNIDIKGGIQTQRYTECGDWPKLPNDAIAKKGLTADRVDGAGSQFLLGKHAYQAVAEKVLSENSLDLLFLYDANPIYETPGGGKFKEIFKSIPYIVSFSSFMDESSEMADLVLPEPTFMERWQDDFFEGIGYPGIGLRQPVVEPIHNTMNTGDFFLKVSEAIGGPVSRAFPWKTYEEVLQDRLQDVGTDWETLKELGVWLTPGYRNSRRGSSRWVSEVIGKDRNLSPKDGRFDFFSRELFCILGNLSNEQLADMGAGVSGDALYMPHYEEVKYAGDADNYPLLLNVVTLMSLGSYGNNANLPSLQEINGMTVGQKWDSWLEINPETAHELHLQNLDEVWIESQFGKIKTKLQLVKGVHPGVVNLPNNMGHTAIGKWAKNRGVNGLSIMNPASEPFTGLASFTNTRVKVYRA